MYVAVKSLEDFRVCGQPTECMSLVLIGVLKESINRILRVLEISAPKVGGHLRKRI